MANYELFENLNQYINTFNKIIKEKSPELRNYLGDHNKFYVDVFSGLEWIVSAIDETTDINGIKISDDERKIFKLYAEAYNNNDLILLADYIEYEIIPMIANWTKSINGVKILKAENS